MKLIQSNLARISSCCVVLRCLVRFDQRAPSNDGRPLSRDLPATAPATASREFPKKTKPLDSRAKFPKQSAVLCLNFVVNVVRGLHAQQRGDDFRLTARCVVLQCPGLEAFVSAPRVTKGELERPHTLLITTFVSLSVNFTFWISERTGYCGFSAGNYDYALSGTHIDSHLQSYTRLSTHTPQLASAQRNFFAERTAHQTVLGPCPRQKRTQCPHSAACGRQ